MSRAAILGSSSVEVCLKYRCDEVLDYLCVRKASIIMLLLTVAQGAYTPHSKTRTVSGSEQLAVMQ